MDQIKSDNLNHQLSAVNSSVLLSQDNITIPGSSVESRKIPNIQEHKKSVGAS